MRPLSIPEGEILYGDLPAAKRSPLQTEDASCLFKTETFPSLKYAPRSVQRLVRTDHCGTPPLSSTQGSRFVCSEDPQFLSPKSPDILKMDPLQSESNGEENPQCAEEEEEEEVDPRIQVRVFFNVVATSESDIETTT